MFASGYRHALAATDAASDPFWKWFAGFSPTIEYRRATFEGARKQAVAVGQTLHDLCGSIRALNTAIYGKPVSGAITVPEDARKKRVERARELANQLCLGSWIARYFPNPETRRSAGDSTWVFRSHFSHRLNPSTNPTISCFFFSNIPNTATIPTPSPIPATIHGQFDPAVTAA